MAYILGVLLGDGSVCWANGTFAIELVTTKKEFAESFCEALKRIGLPAVCKERQRDCYKQGYYYQTRVCSKAFGEWFVDLTYQEIYYEILVYSKDMIRAFLRGFFESEGTFCERVRTSRLYNSSWYANTVFFTNTDTELLEFVGALIDELGYHADIHKANNEGATFKPTRALYRLMLHGSADTKINFVNELNPCIKGGV